MNQGGESPHHNGLLRRDNLKTAVVTTDFSEYWDGKELVTLALVTFRGSLAAPSFLGDLVHNP